MARILAVCCLFLALFHLSYKLNKYFKPFRDKIKYMKKNVVWMIKSINYGVSVPNNILKLAFIVLI